MGHAHLVRDNDRKILREVGNNLVLIALKREFPGQIVDQFCKVDFGFVQRDPACLQLRGIQQVLNHRGQMIGFLLNHLQALRHHRLIPFHIFTPKRAGVAFDQGDRGFEFMTHNRNKVGLELLRFPEAGDIAD